ncbi:hypothetical protein CDD83_1727 [Cordyceps sp. RAO-2017]|nr:hypothetical protein CDD83_1727 [Cordyceps sp. RAO-2017]
MGWRCGLRDQTVSGASGVLAGAPGRASLPLGQATCVTCKTGGSSMFDGGGAGARHVSPGARERRGSAKRASRYVMEATAPSRKAARRAAKKKRAPYRRGACRRASTEDPSASRAAQANARDRDAPPYPPPSDPVC